MNIYSQNLFIQLARRIQAPFSSFCLRFIFLLTLSTSNCFALVIFEDDFNRSNQNELQNGWVELEKDNNDVALYRQQARLRDHQTGTDASLARTVNLAYPLSTAQPAIIAFDWRASQDTEASDSLYMGIQTADNTLQSLWQTALGGSDFQRVEVFVTEEQLSSLEFTLAFWIDVGSASETAYLDNISIVQDELIAIPPTTVPEPGSAFLLLSGSLIIVARKAVISRRAISKPACS